MKAIWHRPGSAVTIGEYNINNGLIYVGDSLRAYDSNENDSCLINPNLKIAPGDPCLAGLGIGKFPNYAEISPEARGAYLEWLSTGRSNRKARIEYVTLFFYGFERRVIFEHEEERVLQKERDEIIEELRRLRIFYAHTHPTFKYCLREFLAMEYILNHERLNLSEDVDINGGYSTDFIRFLLAQKANSGEPISAPLAYLWVLHHPSEEFSIHYTYLYHKKIKELFCLRYKDQFGDGFIIKPNSSIFKTTYFFCNPSLWSYLEYTIDELSDPFLLKQPVKKFQQLFLSCEKDMEPYHRYLNTHDVSPNSFEAKSLLPKDFHEASENSWMKKNNQDNKTKILGPTVAPPKDIIVPSLFEDNHRQDTIVINNNKSMDSQTADSKNNIVINEYKQERPNAQVFNYEPTAAFLKEQTRNGLELTPLKELYGILKVIPPQGLQKNDSERLAIICERLGFGIIPDIRFYDQIPDINDNVVFFPLNNGPIDAPSEIFSSSIIFLRLGAIVSRCDFDVSKPEIDILQNFIESRDLTKAEKDSLNAFLYFCLYGPKNEVNLQKNLQFLDASGKNALRRLIISITLADEIIDSREILELEKLYAFLGLEKKSVTRDLLAMAREFDPEYASFGTRDAQTEVAKSPAVSSTHGNVLVLDSVLIEKLEKSTQITQALLQNPSLSDNDIEPLSNKTINSSLNAPISSLSEPHANLLRELMSKSQWDRDAIINYCANNKIMMDGALEAINELTFKMTNSLLIEDDGKTFFIDIEIAKTIIGNIL
jgi:hypothetical protein